jgi:hypothetical protein
MEKQLFIDVYNNKEFSCKIHGMLKTIYCHNRSVLEEQAIDLDDFIQEMWCQLFEEPTFSPDLAYCFNNIKHNAINYIRDVKNRHLIAPMVSFEESEEYA